MKKISKVYLGLTLLLLSPIIVSANTISSKTICNKTKIMIGEKITCEVSITSEEYLDNITTNINYDKKYLLLESIQGLNTFKSYSNQTFNLKSNEKMALSNTEVAKLTFKAKATPNNGNVEISLGDSAYKEKKSSQVKILSNDNYLKNLTIKGYSFSFNKKTNEYKLNINKEKVSINATLNDTRSTFVREQGPREVNLEYGENTIYIGVKSESGNINTYILKITRNDERKSNNNLKTLEVKNYKLDKEFSPNILNYKLEVENNIKEVEIISTLEEQTSTYNGNNKPGIYELKEGENNIKIQVKAQNNNIKTYTITITRKAKAPDNHLSSIKLSTGVIDFKEDKFNYKFNVANEIETIEITATPKNKTSQVKINKEPTLKEGKNIITIVVTSNDNKSCTYTLEINRLTKEEILSSDTTLKELIIKNYKISFDPNNHRYNLTIKREQSLDIKATPNDNNATITIIGNKNLKDNSIIKIYVTSEDTSQSTYTIKITKDKTYLYIILITSIIAIITVFIVAIILRKKKKQKDKFDESLINVDEKQRLILK